MKRETKTLRAKWFNSDGGGCYEQETVSAELVTALPDSGIDESSTELPEVSSTTDSISTNGIK